MNLHTITFAIYTYYLLACSAHIMLDAHVRECMHINVPVSIPHVIEAAEHGQRVTGQPLAYIFQHLNAEDSQRVAICLKDFHFHMDRTAFQIVCANATSYHSVLHVEEIFELTETISGLDLPFSAFIQGFLSNREDYGLRLEHLLAHGLPLSSIEVHILGQLGLHVSPSATRALTIFELGKTLKLIKNEDFCSSRIFVDFVLNYVMGQYENFPMRGAIVQDLMVVYSSVKDTNGHWLESLMEIGFEIDISMLIVAVDSGEECNLVSVLALLEEDKIASNAQRLLSAYRSSDFKDESKPFQELFQKLLKVSVSKHYRPDSCHMFEIVLSRPKCMMLLYECMPEILGVISRKILINLTLSKLFFKSLIKGFKGPDRFLELSRLEIGHWLIKQIHESFDPKHITCGLQYLKHCGKIESPSFGDVTPLHVLCSKIPDLEHGIALDLTEAFLNAGADVHSLLDGKTPLDLVLLHQQTSVQIKVISSLIKAGATFDHVVGRHYHRLIRIALWHTSIKHILEGLADPNSSLYEDGLDIGHLFSRAILGYEQ